MTATPVRPGSIVVGVDGSGPSDDALRWACEQAAAEGRSLTLVHGLAHVALAWGDPLGYDPQLVEDSADRAGGALLEAARGVVEQAVPQVEVHTRLVMNDPRTALLEIAQDAAMLVVGSRGRGPVARLVLGSVSSAVSQHAPCPVVVVRAHAPGYRRYGVLVGVDADGHSQPAVELAFRLASSRGLPLTAMHCGLDLVGPMPGPSEIPYDTPDHEGSRLVLDEAVAGLREKFPDVAVELVIGRGLVEDVLVEAAARMHVVVVGTHHVDLPSTLFDQHTDHLVVTRAALVVVVVPDLATQPPG
jgi:nucleotide-binding universal stress UspA family protein